MTEREVLKLALDFVEDVYLGEWRGPTERQEEVITAIKEALREHAMYEVQRLGQEIQPEQEPVAMTITGKLGNIYSFAGDYSLKKGDKVYTTPPQRTWVGLTDEEMSKEVEKEEQAYGFIQGALWAEAKLKEKNT